MAEIALEAVTIRTPCSPSNKYLKHDLQKSTFVTNYMFRWKRRLLSSWSYAHVTKLSYVCARAKSPKHSLPLNWYVKVKRVRNELRVDTLQGAIYFFLSGRHFFYLHIVNTIGRWTKALHVEEMFESVQKITHKYATSNWKKKKKTPTKWLSFLAKSAYSQPTDCRALDDKTLMLVSHDIDG